MLCCSVAFIEGAEGSGLLAACFDLSEIDVVLPASSLDSRGVRGEHLLGTKWDPGVPGVLVGKA